MGRDAYMPDDDPVIASALYILISMVVVKLYVFDIKPHSPLRHLRELA